MELNSVCLSIMNDLHEHIQEDYAMSRLFQLSVQLNFNETISN